MPALELGPVLAQTCRVLRRTALVSVPVALVLYAPLALWVTGAVERAWAWDPENAPPWAWEIAEQAGYSVRILGAVLAWLLGMLLQGALAGWIHRYLVDPPGGGASPPGAVRRFPSVLAVALALGVLVWGALFAAGGLASLHAALSLPMSLVGLVAAAVLAARWFVSMTAVALEPLGTAEALARSAALTAGSRRRVLELVVLVQGSAWLGVAFLDGVALPPRTPAAARATLLAGFGWQAVVAALHATLATVVYARLRRRAVGPGPAELQEVFG